MTVSTDWGDVRLTADDWAEAFEAPDQGTPHNEAREQIWEELVAILLDKLDGDVPGHAFERSLRYDEELVTTLHRAWPLLEATDLVSDLWTVPAYLRLCAPWLSTDEVRRLQRKDAPQAWTVSDLPLLDAARQRLGDPEAARTKRRHAAMLAAQRERMTQVVDNLIDAAAASGADLDEGEGLVTMLRGQDAQVSLVDEAELTVAEPDLLAGPFAHIVVDEAQELTDAEWQMLLSRCPSRSFTIVGPRPRPGPARLHRVVAGAARTDRPGPDRGGLPEHQLPHAGRGHGGGRAGHPGRAPGRQRADLHPPRRHPRHPRPGGRPRQGPRRLARRPRRRHRLRHRRPHVPGDAGASGRCPRSWRRAWSSTSVVLVDPDDFGDGVQGAVDR
ncbi:AAA family ATPase OS=Streptomyces rimosus subsp. rimosus (strain ATCC / DSM 40260 / JCM 4667/ NRRL 2234) OX=1265868 GN=SRIM_006270 PE=4 SV=1 [Streptomyces rimosus subsp. rimosus]